MITDVQYLQLVSEAYDLSDYSTKKNVLFCNEAKKVVNIENIVGRLYNHIKSNVTGIDFGTIPKSKGVFSHVENYGDIIDCLNSIHDMVREYNESSSIVDEISTAIDNIQKRERYFTKAFALNIEFPMMIYNMTVLSIVSATSLMITSSIEFIKNGHDSFNAAFDKVGYVKSRDHVLYKYITQFNHNCSDGTIDKLISECIKNNLVAVKEDTDIVNEGIIGDVVKAGVNSGIAGAAGYVATKAIKSGMKTNFTPLKIVAIIIACGILAIKFVQFLRVASYYFLHSMMKISDWFEAQANYLRINAENLKYRDDEKGDDHRKEVYQSQMRWVDRFKKISNFFALKDSKARKETEKDDEDYSRKRRYEDDQNSDDGLF